MWRLTKGSDARLAIKNLALPVLAVPAVPVNDKNKSLNRIWEKEIDEYVRRKMYLADNIQMVYFLVWGQCTDVMRQKVEALAIYEALTTNGDGLELSKLSRILSTISRVRNIYPTPSTSPNDASTYACRVHAQMRSRPPRAPNRQTNAHSWSR
jgi:hypothetical protein